MIDTVSPTPIPRAASARVRVGGRWDPPFHRVGAGYPGVTRPEEGGDDPPTVDGS